MAEKGFYAHAQDLRKHLIGYFGINETLITFLYALTLFFIVLMVYPRLIWIGFQIVLWAAPFWLPYMLFWDWWETYVQAIRARFIASNEMILLEVKVPRDIDKSPRAMELVFAGMHYTGGESTFIARWKEGKTRAYFSFEIASIEGRIGFYIWTRKSMRHMVEAQIYAQYPEVEIVEADDYTKGVRYVPGVNEVWGTGYRLANDDVLPIKTYVDYELDKDPKEEYKIDPLAHLLEYMGTMGPGEHLWLQFIVRANKDVVPEKGSKFKWTGRWQTQAKEKIAEIRKASSTKTQYVDPVTQKVIETEGFPNPTPAQRQQIEAIERSLSKAAFDVGMRAIYLARKDAFRGVNVPGVITMFRQFGSSNLNGFVVTDWNAGFDYPWQDYKGLRQAWVKKKVIQLYQQRIYFYPEFSWAEQLLLPPIQKPSFVLTSEELATVYHFPSRIIQTPGLSRIPAKKAEAPPNLPV